VKTSGKEVKDATKKKMAKIKDKEKNF